jgi:hypothetical protein
MWPLPGARGHRNFSPGSYYEPGLKCSTRGSLSLSLYFSAFQLLCYPFVCILLHSIFWFISNKFSYIHIHTIQHSIHANTYIIYLVWWAYIQVYTTCLITHISMKITTCLITHIYNLSNQNPNEIHPLGVWHGQAGIPSILLKFLLCIQSVRANSDLLRTTKKEINININHHNKYYEWH